MCGTLGVDSTASLVQDVRTRWDSTLTMLESFAAKREVVQLYCSRYDTPAALDKALWDILDPTIYVLAPVRDLTLTFSGSAGQISMVLPKVSHGYIMQCKTIKTNNDNE